MYITDPRANLSYSLLHKHCKMLNKMAIYMIVLNLTVGKEVSSQTTVVFFFFFSVLQEKYFQSSF